MRHGSLHNEVDVTDYKKQKTRKKILQSKKVLVHLHIHYIKYNKHRKSHKYILINILQYRIEHFNEEI